MLEAGLARLLDGLGIEVLVAHSAAAKLGLLLDRLHLRLRLLSHLFSLFSSPMGVDRGNRSIGIITSIPTLS
jgi:hypothetical protein